MVAHAASFNGRWIAPREKEGRELSHRKYEGSQSTLRAAVVSSSNGGAGLPEFSNHAVRFGSFEVNFAGAEIRKHGVRLRLQEQPFQVLAALLERPGEVVTREDLIRRLWADGTVVDFDRGLNAAVTRLRQALSDSADVPRYVETVARRGYRFIGSVESARDEVRPAPLPMPSRRTRTWAAAILIFAIALFAGWWWSTRAYSRRSETALKVVPLTTGAGVERNPSFSPDGTQIVYEWVKEDGQRHLYIKVVGSGDPVPLTSGDAAEYGPAWAPDGRLIAFLRQLDQSTMGVFVKPPLGGVERKITEVAPPRSDSVLRRFLRRLDWTHDSRHLVVSAPAHMGGSEGLLLVSVDNGEKTWLTEPSGDSEIGDREPAVSPDGRMVAFARGELGSGEALHLLALTSNLRPAGAPKQLASAGHSRSPAWTADGRRIVYTDLSPGITFGSGAWTIGLDAGDVPHPLPALGRNVALPAVARTGRLAYSRQILQSNIWRQEIPLRGAAIPQPVRLTASSAVDYNAQYSPDGGRIAFSSNRSGSREIWTCASDGAQCVQVTTFNGFTGTPRWSPDGRRIAFDSAAAGQMDVYVVDASGGSPSRLTDVTHGNVPSWSHDGRWIYFSSRVTGRNEIWKIPSAGGKAVQVTRNGGFIAFESPDRRALFYMKTDQNAKLWKSAVDGSGETEVLDDVDARGFVVTADRVYYLRQERNDLFAIRRYVIATHEDSQIVSLAKPVFWGLSISPDGKCLIYSQRLEASNLMLVEDFH
jgi:Tol biopolymer transport system component/DNA-binding winged helix-turn-helix (wHTH) protein